MIEYEKIQKMSVAQLDTLKDNIEFIKRQKIKEEIRVGAEVYIVQKTKKTLGIIKKIMNKKCLVEINSSFSKSFQAKQNTLTYRVPITMLELRTA
jgi:transcription elongation factor